MSIKQNGGVFGRNPTFNDVTIEGQLTFEGNIDIDSDITWEDGKKALFGDSGDLQIYHDSSDSYIKDVGTGDLKIMGANVEIATVGGNKYFDGAVNVATLYHTNNPKLATTSSGVDVTGNTESDTVTIGTSAVVGSEKLRVNGTVLTLGGSNSVPAIGIGDVNTGVYAPTAGELGWTVNGQQKLLLNSSGVDVTGTAKVSTSMMVGSTDSPSYALHVKTNAGYTAEFQNTAGANHRPVRWTDNSGATVGTLGGDFTANDFILQGIGRPLVLGSGANGQEAMRLDASQNVSIPNGTLSVGGAGTIGTHLSRIHMSSGTAGLFVDGGGTPAIWPWKSTATTSGNADAEVDLGDASNRFKEAYLSGGVYLGGTGTANKLDDYEEGTFTASLRGGTSEPATLITADIAKYTKIGDMVHIEISFENETTTGYAGALTVTGLPFTSGGGRTMLSVAHYQGTTWADGLIPISLIGSGSTQVDFLNLQSGSAWSVNQHNSAGGGRYLWVSGAYKI